MNLEQARVTMIKPAKYRFIIRIREMDRHFVWTQEATSQGHY